MDTETVDQEIEKSVRFYLNKHFPLKSLLFKQEKLIGNLGFNQHEGSKALKFFIRFLQLLPWICAIGFGISFFPFAQFSYSFQLPLIEKTVSFEGFLRIIAVSGLIGFSTNKLAIRMLFRPLKKRPIWGQGLIPAQKDRIIFTLAKGMHEHILSQKLIRKRLESSGLISRINHLLIQGSIGVLQDEELKESLKKMIYEGMKSYLSEQNVRQEIINIIDQRVEENMEAGVKKFLLQTYKRYNKEDYEEIIQKVIRDIPKVSIEVLNKIEEELDRLAALLRHKKNWTEQFIMDLIMDTLEKIDIPGILRGQMEHFDEERLERMVRDATNEQLIYIQYLGALLGMLGGLLIWQPELMTLTFILLFGLLYLLDHLIFQFKSSAS